MEALGNKPRHKQTKIRHNNKALWNVMGKFMMKCISSFSLEQNSGCSCRQAFIHYCGLHQVWGITEKLHLIWVLRGSMKKEVGIIELRGQKGCHYSKKYYIKLWL